MSMKMDCIRFYELLPNILEIPEVLLMYPLLRFGVGLLLV